MIENIHHETSHIVRSAIAEVLCCSPVSIRDRNRLVEDLELDSLVSITVIQAIEARTSIRLPVETVAQAITVDDLIHILKDTEAA